MARKRRKRNHDLPRMVFADAEGRIYDHPTALMVGFDGRRVRAPREDELVPLPEGSDCFVLPGRRPVGLDRRTGRVVTDQAGDQVAVAAFLAPAYVRLLHPATQRCPAAPTLPTYAYAALGWRSGRFWTAGFRVDPERRQDPVLFDLTEIRRSAHGHVSQHGSNRLIRHLKHCALVYGCRAAQNFFLERWECPLPTSPACNAACVGCISLQPEGTKPASHDRIDFVPTPEEIAEVALMHIERVRKPVASFGQGCEGEPLLVADVLQASLRLIRSRTGLGTLNLNTNASLPDKVVALVGAGLDSMRVSIASAQPQLFQHYHRPKNYGLGDVIEAMKVVNWAGRFLSLNLLVFPGVTDTEAELEALVELAHKAPFQMVQMRNLNIDPDEYLQMATQDKEPMGIRRWMDRLSKALPHLRFGYFNPPKETF